MPKQAVCRNQAAQFARHRRILRDLRAEVGVFAHERQRSVGAGHRLAQFRLIKLFARQRFERARQLAELIGDVGNGRVVLAGGHIDEGQRRGIMRGQMTEGKLVRVTGQRRSGNQQRFGQHAGFRHADHRLVVRAEALRNAGSFRAFGKDMLAGRAGDVNRQPLRKHRRKPHRVHQLTGHEDVDHHGLLGLIHAADERIRDASIHPRVSGFRVRQLFAFAGKAHPRIGMRRARRGWGAT